MVCSELLRLLLENMCYRHRKTGTDTLLFWPAQTAEKNYDLTQQISCAKRKTNAKRK